MFVEVFVRIRPKSSNTSVFAEVFARGTSDSRAPGLADDDASVIHRPKRSVVPNRAI